MGTDLTWVDSEGTLHEQYTILFFLGHSELGSARMDPGACPGLRYRRSGLAFFCPECGEVWARAFWLDSKGQLSPFTAEVQCCEQHGGGSLLSLSALLEILPREALAREFELLIKEIA